MQQLPAFFASFVVVALAASVVGRFAKRLRLPYITGYLFTGIIVGPFVLNIETSAAVESLYFIEEISLAFIAFAAGSELFLKELRSRLKSIAWVTVGLVTATFTLGSIAIYLLSGVIPFLQDLPPAGRVAAAILAGAIMVARSPSSAIAVMNELRARGPFTKTVLGVTVVMDIVVIVVFAVSSSLADALLNSINPGVEFVVLLLIELGLAFAAGYGVGWVLYAILRMRIPQHFKTGLVLLAGFLVFIASHLLREWTHANLPFELLLEPLLICVTASFFVTNFTPHRDEFQQIIHDASQPVFIIFFTLTGASIALDVLIATWPVTLVLFVVRLVGITIGSFSGGTLAGDPRRTNRLLWMGFVTQAGIALGLSREVATEFPLFGDSFATMLISVIVMNEMVGPLFMKAAIRRAGEAYEPETAPTDEVRDALILGIEGQSRALARQLKAYNWHVVLADMDGQDRENADGIWHYHVDDISKEGLRHVLGSGTDALVAMLNDDADNLKACQIAYEQYGIRRLVVRLNDLKWSDRFTALGATVIDPASATVYLMDQSVRAPQTAAMLLHRDPQYEITQITITNPDVSNLQVRDLRLPGDVLILSVMRDTQSIVPSGYTTLHLRDELTLVGTPASLEAVTLHLGY
ncbi:MAG: cation:proton antiporter [Anaerolineae bacterium]|nr:cation:proton antiporter [Anaerolineae bacterium]